MVTDERRSTRQPLLSYIRQTGVAEAEVVVARVVLAALVLVAEEIDPVREGLCAFVTAEGRQPVEAMPCVGGFPDCERRAHRLLRPVRGLARHR